jgi:hypothetical protein
MKIHKSTILAVYRKYGIKRKSLRYVKTLRYQDPKRRHAAILHMRQELQQAMIAGKRVIYIDEAMFTTSTLPTRGFAGKNENVVVEEKLISTPALAVVAGVSAERGLEAFHIQPKSIDSDALIQFLLTILAHSKPSEFTIFADNCRVHHSKKVDKFVQEPGFSIILNVPYGPEYNPIERVWS